MGRIGILMFCYRPRWLSALACCLAFSASAQNEEPFSLKDVFEPSADPAAGAGADGQDDDLGGFFDDLTDNLRINIDYITRFSTTSKRGELAAVNAIGLDIHKVFSDERGDIGTLLLQPYIVRRDNVYNRLLELPNDDAFIIELHDFYFNYTRIDRGRLNIKVGHFDVPFGLEPNVDTHLTLRQLIPMHDAGFKKDWGASLNGSLPDFDYEVSLTRGTGPDLNDRGHDTYLAAARIGTPWDKNFVIGVSGFYGEVADEHGSHRVDEGDPRGDFRELDEWVRRWRVGVDVTQVIDQFTLSGEFSAGEDFDQEIVNTLVEVMWSTADETFSAYVQGVYLSQNGHLGWWSPDIKSRIGFKWQMTEVLSVSAAWTHEFATYANETRGPHSHEDTYVVQFRVTF